jgi:hypothetical protein
MTPARSSTGPGTGEGREEGSRLVTGEGREESSRQQQDDLIPYRDRPQRSIGTIRIANRTRLLLANGSKLTIAYLPKTPCKLSTISSANVGFKILGLATEGESVAVTGPMRCVVFELGLVDQKKSMIVDKERLEVSVENDQQVELCEWLGHHCLAILTNDGVTIMVRPYLKAVCRINGDVTDIAWDSTHDRLLLLCYSGEVKIVSLDEMKEKKALDLTSIGSIIRDVDTFHYRAFTDSLYYSDGQGDAWSSKIDSAGTPCATVKLIVENSMKNVDNPEISNKVS